MLKFYLLNVFSFTHVFLPSILRLDTADGEIKVASGENLENVNSSLFGFA